MYPYKNHLYYGIFVKEFVESLLQEEINVDVVFINARENKCNYFFTPIEIFKKLRSKKYDLIHLQHTFLVLPTILGQLFSQCFISRILTFHEAEFFARKDVLRELKRKRRWIEKIVFSRVLKKFFVYLSDYCIFVNSKIPEEMELRRTKYSVIPPGVDLTLFRPIERDIAREFLHLPKDKIIILFPANPEQRRKGFHLFEKALSYLPQDIKQNLEIIVGGNIERGRMVYYINASDLVIQTSLCEASPMIVKEVMAAGKPMLSTEVGDVKEMFDNVKGYFISSFEPKEIAETLRLALNFKHSTKGRKRIIERRLRVEDIAKKTASLYRKLLYN
jgi:glycosyltransferase involved in cell wall biosynthesis